MIKQNLSLLLLLLLISPHYSFAAKQSATEQNTAQKFIEKHQQEGKKSNRLLSEKSPYLLKHAFNPVDWYAWGDEAFQKARQEDKPIVLSVGYSTCHWCNVMEEESFENNKIAKIMNDNFVSIKVDREERPDVDKLYMSATIAFTGSGGWPMTVFLTPDLKPFYAGTYFPPEARYGRAGFGDLLQTIAKAWKEERQQLVDKADSVLISLKNTGKPKNSSQSEINAEFLDKAFEKYKEQFDKKYGGFGQKTKFPRPSTNLFLLRYQMRNPTSIAGEMVRKTLLEMAAGGINDQLAGGFHRYAVDAQWRIPHFEKMLYDQALLTVLYLEGYQFFGNAVFAETADSILSYVLEEMKAPNGGFYSALDADSPVPEDPSKKAEGAYYLWTVKELDELLGKQNSKLFRERFGFSDLGNLYYDPHDEFGNKNILFQAKSLTDLQKEFTISNEELNKSLAQSLQKLKETRASRPKPYLDDKQITAWNALMVSAFVKGARVLNKDEYLNVAKQAAEFLITTVYDDKTGQLKRRYRAGEAGLSGQLPDYAYFTQAILDLFEATQNLRYLNLADKLNQTTYELFHDQDVGNLFENTADKNVLLRMKPDFEGAQPSGNSIAALNFLRLGLYTSDEAWQKRAAAIIDGFADKLEKSAAALPHLLIALDLYLTKPQHIIIAGDPDRKDTKILLQEINRRFLPHALILIADGGINQQKFAENLPEIKAMRPINDKATAYVCEDFACRLPTNNLEKLKEILDALRETNDEENEESQE